MNKDIHMKFVAGNDFQFQPRAFAQRFFYKASDELPEDLSEILDEQNIIRTRPSGRMIFRQGADGVDEDTETLQQPPFSNPQRPQPPRPQPPRPPRPQQPADIARDAYNKMLILGQLYRGLESFNTSYSDELQDMISELNVVTFAMGRIYQSLSRNNRLPIQNQRKPQIRGFCRGVVTTSNWLRDILFDVRNLQRLVQNQNIDTQLVIINLTLMAQQQQLQQMRQDCMDGGVR